MYAFTLLHIHCHCFHINHLSECCSYLFPCSYCVICGWWVDILIYIKPALLHRTGPGSGRCRSSAPAGTVHSGTRTLTEAYCCLCSEWHLQALSRTCPDCGGCWRHCSPGPDDPQPWCQAQGKLYPCQGQGEGSDGGWGWGVKRYRSSSEDVCNFVQSKVILSWGDFSAACCVNAYGNWLTALCSCVQPVVWMCTGTDWLRCVRVCSLLCECVQELTDCVVFGCAACCVNVYRNWLTVLCSGVQPVVWMRTGTDCVVLGCAACCVNAYRNWLTVLCWGVQPVVWMHTGTDWLCCVGVCSLLCECIQELTDCVVLGCAACCVNAYRNWLTVLCWGVQPVVWMHTGTDWLCCVGVCSLLCECIQELTDCVVLGCAAPGVLSPESDRQAFCWPGWDGGGGWDLPCSPHLPQRPRWICQEECCHAYQGNLQTHSRGKMVWTFQPNSNQKVVCTHVCVCVLLGVGEENEEATGCADSGVCSKTIAVFKAQLHGKQFDCNERSSALMYPVCCDI